MKKILGIITAVVLTAGLLVQASDLVIESKTQSYEEKDNKKEEDKKSDEDKKDEK